MTTNPSYKPNENKREEFRRYLEKTGVMDALTKVLVLLYEEADKPDDALTFIQNTLARQSGNETMEEMKAQITELQERLTLLEEENQRLISQGVPEQNGEEEGEEGQAVEEIPTVTSATVAPPASTTAYTAAATAAVAPAAPTAAPAVE